ncbi:MAG: endonuclease Q family protein [Candidatus Hermodarchaeota archaeon]
MDIFNADLHIHSPHSIAVSKSLNLDTMLETCKKKGLNILGTGDILQPEWFKYMESNLERQKDGSYSYNDVFFVLQTEIEDVESIHHVVLFPDFNSVKEIQNKLKPFSKNILDEWGGRPRVNVSPSALVDIITDSGGIIGPAHAFTPFKAIFRQGKFENLEDCYESASKKVDFIELGLSANTNLADRLESLKNVSFLSNSDAHSQDPRSLGREFNRFDIDNPSFDEILLALQRKNGRKITLNIGLHPKLGKYYNMFCNKCRRRILFKKLKKETNNVFNQYSLTENFVINYSNDPVSSRLDYLEQVSKNKINCPACKEHLNKNFKVKLGVSERIEKISTFLEPRHPVHRPPYINAIPLIDIICAVKGIKSTSSKSVLNEYNRIIKEVGTEFEILIDTNITKIESFDSNIASVINAFRNNEVEYTPGGGGTYGQIKLDI